MLKFLIFLIRERNTSIILFIQHFQTVKIQRFFLSLSISGHETFNALYNEDKSVLDDQETDFQDSKGNLEVSIHFT